LKAGQVPKRGGPKEEEDNELNKELQGLSDQQAAEKNFANDEMLKHETMQKNIDEPAVKRETHKTDEKSSPEIKKDTPINLNPEGNFFEENKTNKVKKNTMPQKNYDHDNLTDINSTNTILNPNINHNFNPDINITVPKSDIKSNINPNNFNKKEEKKNLTQKQDTSHARKASENTSMKGSILATDYKIDPSMKVKKLDFELPVKFKTTHYFNLVNTIKKQLETGDKEISANKVDKALAHMELVLYYLNNVDQ
jgi:hypothetical protein